MPIEIAVVLALMVIVGVLALSRRRREKVPPIVEAPKPEPVCAINVQPPDTQESVTRVLEALRELGIRHIRTSWWAWSSHEPGRPGNWAWLPSFREAGIEVLPLVYPNSYPNIDPKPEEAGERMAGRYRDLFDAFGPFPYLQLGNEVDGAGPFGIEAPADPYEQGARWAEQMVIAAQLIRRFDPAAKIVTAGLAWNHDGVEDFVRGMVSVGGFDVLAIHCYGVHVFGEPLFRWQAVRAAGWSGPIWCSEWGVSDVEARYAGVDPDDWQVENWRRVLSEDAARYGYERLYGFQLTPAPQGWGLLGYPDWAPRPAYRWLRSWRGSPAK